MQRTNTFPRPNMPIAKHRWRSASLAGVATLCISAALTAPAEAQLVYLSSTSATAGTTEATKKQQSNESSIGPVEIATASYEEQPGLNFTGTAIGTAVVLVGPSFPAEYVGGSNCEL